MRTLKTGPGADAKCQFCNRKNPQIWDVHSAKTGDSIVGWLTCCGTLLVHGADAIHAATPKKIGGHPNHEEFNAAMRELGESNDPD